MGGRGSSLAGKSAPVTNPYVYVRNNPTQIPPQPPVVQPQNLNNNANSGGGGGGAQQPVNNSQYVKNDAASLSQMGDAQIAQVLNSSIGASMPSHLSDKPDATQSFVYTAGVNGAPTVLDKTQFQAYLKANKIPKSQILSRSTDGAHYSVNGVNVNMTADQCLDLLKYGKFNYIGGKFGGKAYGSGTYMDMNGGKNTGYGSRSARTMIAVLNPQTARIVDSNTLDGLVASMSKTKPQLYQAMVKAGYIRKSSWGTNVMSEAKSIVALAHGYNVIKGGSYHNIIDRSALIIQAENV